MTYEAAVQIWNEMTAMDRIAIIQRVGHMKSVTKMHRACIAAIQAGV